MTAHRSRPWWRRREPNRDTHGVTSYEFNLKDIPPGGSVTFEIPIRFDNPGYEFGAKPRRWWSRWTR